MLKDFFIFIFFYNPKNLLHQKLHMLKNLQSCYSALSFLRPHCSNMLSLFINFFLSLFCVCLLPKSLLSPLSLLLYHTISPKLLPLPLTILANSFTTTNFYYFFLPFHFPFHSLSCSLSFSPSGVSLSQASPP